MILLYRARLALVVAVIASIVLLAVEFPISEFLRQRAAINAATTQLAGVDAHNSQLRGDVAALRNTQAIGAIAHEEYGLVSPGEQSYVILPSRSNTGASGALAGSNTLPAGDLVASSTPNTSTASTAPRSHGSLLHRVADRLEFWRWAF